MTVKHFFIMKNNITSFLFLFLLSFFMLGANPFKSETIAPMDLLVKYAGWQNTNIKIDYINGERSDILDAKLPIWINAKYTLYQGEIPYWNHQRGGKPALTFTNSLFTPAFFTFAIIPNHALGYYLSNLINVLIGLLGMYLFLRLFLNKIASSFGAFIFMFSGFNVAWFFWAHVNTAIWTPWVLFTVYKYIESKEKKYLPYITLSMLMLNLGGFPMIAVMTYMALAIMIVIISFSQYKHIKEWINMLIHIFIYASLAVIIAIPFIYPLVELLDWMGGIGYRHGGAGFSLSAFELFINPDFYRTPRVETTFYVGLLPILFLAITPILYLFKRNFIALFAFILFLFSITIAFTLIPAELIHKIPTLNSSLLTRFGFLIGVSLAIISAYVLHTIIEKYHQKKWIYLIIILVFSIQIFEQRKLFNHFNAAVPNASFYPSTKSIHHIQTHTTPFQHVMADSGFLIAGTLGGYKLNDWYAHSFHSQNEKKILNQLVNKPFKTPTSSIFVFSQIHIDSPYMDYLGIKYILSSTLVREQSIPIGDVREGQTPSPLLSIHPFMQVFEVSKKIDAYGISLLMATYGAKQASSDLELIIMQENIKIASSLVKKENVHDNQWVPFKFKKPLTIQKGKYTLSIKMLNNNNRQALSLWSNTNESKYKLLVDNKELNISLKIGWSKQLSLGKKFKIHKLEQNIHIIENLHIKGDAYFLKALDTTEAIDYNYIKTKLLSNTEIKINYNHTQSGWIILPMHKYPGWKVTVNGQSVDTKEFLGMIPAIKVEGKSTILFTYNPDYNKYTYALSLLGILILLFSFLKFRRKILP